MAVIRIPNLPMGKMVDKEGDPTDNEMTFRQALITSLQSYMGNEGLVAPSQNSTNITAIQNNRVPNPVTGVPDAYSCEPGTIIYNTTTNKLMVAVLVAGVPTFQTITSV